MKFVILSLFQMFLVEGRYLGLDIFLVFIFVSEIHMLSTVRTVWEEDQSLVF